MFLLQLFAQFISYLMIYDKKFGIRNKKWILLEDYKVWIELFVFLSRSTERFHLSRFHLSRNIDDIDFPLQKHFINVKKILAVINATYAIAKRTFIYWNIPQFKYMNFIYS